jgi:hypothetical protein
MSLRYCYAQADINARIEEMGQKIQQEEEFMNSLRKKKMSLLKKKERLQTLIAQESQKVKEIEQAKKEQQRLKAEEAAKMKQEEAAKLEAQKKADAQRQEQAKMSLIKEQEEKAKAENQMGNLNKKYQDLVKERKKLETEVKGEEENLKVLVDLKNIETEKRQALEGQ